MQAFVQVYQATQDQSIREYAMRRVNEIIEVERHKNHPSKALVFQGSYPATEWPTPHEFFMPWQHGAVLYGYLGAYKAWNEPVLLQICEDVVDTVEYSWITNMSGHPYFGFIPQGLRYYTPVIYNGAPIPANYFDNLPVGAHVGDSPLGGAHAFLVGGLYTLADWTSNNSVRTRALLYGGMIRGSLSQNGRWNKWYYCLPTQHAQ
jgi:hypothetical protein